MQVNSLTCIVAVLGAQASKAQVGKVMRDVCIVFNCHIHSLPPSLTLTTTCPSNMGHPVTAQCSPPFTLGTLCPTAGPATACQWPVILGAPCPIAGNTFTLGAPCPAAGPAIHFGCHPALLLGLPLPPQPHPCPVGAPLGLLLPPPLPVPPPAPATQIWYIGVFKNR